MIQPYPVGMPYPVIFREERLNSSATHRLISALNSFVCLCLRLLRYKCSFTFSEVFVLWRILQAVWKLSCRAVLLNDLRLRCGVQSNDIGINFCCVRASLLSTAV